MGSGLFSKINLHKTFGTTPNVGFQPKEAISYSIAGFGQNLICGVVGSSVLMYFLTNGLLIDSAIVGVIMLIVRVFDALNDPIMGSVVDRTNSKDGKCRPYLKWMAIPIAAFTVLLFIPLPQKATISIVIITIVYVIWSVVYTIVDVPYWGLATAMTNDTHQRGTLLTVARLFCTLGNGLITLLIPILAGLWIKDYTDSSGAVLPQHESQAALALSKNFWWVVLIIAIISVPMFFIGYKNTKERFFNKDDIRPLKENLKLLSKNKPLILIIISGVLGAGRTIYLYSAIYLAQYNLAAMHIDFFGMQGAQLATLITIAVVPGGLIASLMVPWCTKKFGKRNTYIYSHIFGAIVLFVMYFCGWRSDFGLIVNLFGLILAGIPQGFANITSYAMIADSVDYLEWKEGKRAEGICFSMQTFINKVGMAVGAAVSCFALSWAKIDPSDASTHSLINNEGGLNLLFMITILVPGISILLSVIPFFFYKFDEKQQAVAVAEVMARKGIDRHGAAVE
ncbi:MAG: glycoside-pentoside-hexuronide (GPH):cation symporter [Clostridiales bacterium]|jgi:sugar (glycoside-pentoside-hexuronide) transporter|nr:glycoside-pentoside-hexuronide (GPH):cation symporter [Clostridiales bacterium]